MRQHPEERTVISNLKFEIRTSAHGSTINSSRAVLNGSQLEKENMNNHLARS